MFKNLKFRTKLIFILLTTSFVSIGLVGYFAMVVGKNSLKERIGVDLQVSSNNLMDNIDRFIYERYNDTQILISEPFIRLITEEDITNDRKTEILKSYLVNLGYYNELFLTDQYGLIVASTSDKAIGKDISETEFYYETQKEFLYSSDFIVSSLDEKSTMIFSNLLLDANNNYLGTVIAELNWPAVSEMMDSVGSDTSAYLFNKNGVLIASSVKADENIINNFRPEFDSFLNSQNDSIFITDDKEEYLLSFTKSDGYLGYLGNDWSIILLVPTEFAFAPINKLGLLIIWVLIGVVFIIIIFGYIFSRSLIKPIYHLIEGINVIEKGDLKYKIALKVKDEFGFLANSFNDMTSSLWAKTSELKDAIRHLKEEKKAVMKEESRYKAILEVSGDAVLLVDSNHVIISINNNFKKLFNVKETLFIGKKDSSIIKFFHDKWGSDTFEKIYEQTDKNKFYKKSAVLFHKKPYYILHFLTAPITAKDNKYIGRIWLFRDITDEKELENTKYKFISIASHKLRTPLTGIRWNLDMLLSNKVGSIPPKQREFLNLMNKNSLTLNSLVNLLLNISEIEGGNITLEPQNIDLGNMIKSVLEKFQIEIEIRGINVKMSKFKDGDFIVSIDRAKMRQVFNSVIENAVFYNKDKGEMDIDIGIKGKDVIVKITDSGIGIPENEKRKVFTKFFRGKEAILNYPDGVGLGLYLAKVIVKNSKGKIWFESEENEGTTFYIKIPNIRKK